MNFTLELLPDEPIVIVHFHKSYSDEQDLDELVAGLTSLLDAQPQPMVVIHVDFPIPTGIDDLIRKTNLATNVTGLFKHPKTQLTVMVTANPIFSLAAKGMRSSAFGGVRVETCPTLDKAVERAREAAGQLA